MSASLVGSEMCIRDSIGLCLEAVVKFLDAVPTLGNPSSLAELSEAYSKLPEIPEVVGGPSIYSSLR
eukprot:14085764-Alexandrium_andersonii.AAC.1